MNGAPTTNTTRSSLEGVRQEKSDKACDPSRIFRRVLDEKTSTYKSTPRPFRLRATQTFGRLPHFPSIFLSNTLLGGGRILIQGAAPYTYPIRTEGGT